MTLGLRLRASVLFDVKSPDSDPASSWFRASASRRACRRARRAV